MPAHPFKVVHQILKHVDAPQRWLIQERLRRNEGGRPFTFLHVAPVQPASALSDIRGQHHAHRVHLVDVLALGVDQGGHHHARLLRHIRIAGLQGWCIAALDALPCLGLDVQRYGEQDSKGSLAVGKRADLVILDKNPLKVEPMTIKDIKVIETIKDGKPVYTRS
jgi:hypothetical protein